MGDSPPSSRLLLARYRHSSSSSSPPDPSLSDWFLTSSDLDTHILTQALSDLSSPAPSASRSPPRPPLLCENLPESLHALRALQQQQKQHHQHQTQAAFMSSAWPRHDRLHSSSLQVGSSPSSTSLSSPLSASNPGSPYSHSTITTTNSSMSMPTDRLLGPVNPMNSLQQDVQEGFFASTLNASASRLDDSFMDSKSLRSIRAGSIALSSQESRGAGASKVSKRRSRASNRTPIAVLSADVSNFRAMVQQLTGIPSAPSMHSYGGSSLLKPYPTKNTYTNTASLPTLDTSASFIGSKLTSTKDPLQGFSFTQRNQYPQGGNGGSMHASLYAKESVFGEQASVSSSSSALSSVWNEAACYRKPSGISAAGTEAQPFLSRPVEEHLAMKSQYGGVDSWISFDGVLANQSPNIEIARMA